MDRVLSDEEIKILCEEAFEEGQSFQSGVDYHEYRGGEAPPAFVKSPFETWWDKRMQQEPLFYE